jgi:(2R)-3-sulfolactate dehydrogenase (NADP+)
MATASTARVNLVKAAAEGREIEPGHAIDVDGNPTTDPAAGLKGAQLPVGGPKGFGLGLMVDVLGGVLTGSNCSYEASMFATTEGGPPNVGQTIIAMDPAFFSGGFVAHLESMFTDLTKDNEVRVPGERRAELRRLHEAQGVEVPESLLAQIAELSS